jgi:lipoprotein-anchoring transpeptidase ErfK/SrfK
VPAPRPGADRVPRRERAGGWALPVRAGLVALGALVWLALGPLAAHAGRFGPPWQARVAVDQTTVFARPERGAPGVGPVAKGSIVAVLDEQTAADGTTWDRTPDGYVVAGDLAEEFSPWVAEVVAPSVPIYAYPDAHSGTRRTARQGALLRVTGLAKGINGDPDPWWATTEGYVHLGTLREGTSDWAHQWTLPAPQEATQGWWATVRSQANVRAGTSTDAPVLGQVVPGDRVKVLDETDGQRVSGNPTWYRIDGGRYAGGYVHSSLLARMADPKPNTTSPAAEAPPGPWIVVDRSASSLTLVGQDGQARFTTYVSLGRAGVITPSGAYSTMGKYRADEMTSASVDNPDHQYDLPNVPFTQYYKEGGYAIHGTYWHDQFGSVQSQGCINVTVTDAAYLFDLTQPPVAAGDLARWAINAPATPVLILE